jgi:hypothetical protein
LKPARFGPAPPSSDRVHDHRVRERPWAVAIARPCIRSRFGDRRSGRGGRAYNSGSSHRSTYYYGAAVFASMHSPANASNAHWRKRPSDSGLSLSTDIGVTFADDQLNDAGTAAQTSATLMEESRLSFVIFVSRLLSAKLTGRLRGRFLRTRRFV